jgi:hypothetical protein
MSATTTTDAPTNDDAIRRVVKRLSRPHKSGGTVIERAAILAEGPHASAIVAWIIAHHGEAEAPTAVAAKGGGGLHASRLARNAGAAERAVPRRYVLPASALD